MGFVVTMKHGRVSYNFLVRLSATVSTNEKCVACSLSVYVMDVYEDLMKRKKRKKEHTG